MLETKGRKTFEFTLKVNCLETSTECLIQQME